MRINVSHSLEGYIQAGDETTAAMLASEAPLVMALRDAHAFFADTLWSAEVDMSPTRALLGLNAYMLFTAAVRVSLSGHSSAVYPLLRTAVESACYGFLVGRDSTLAEVWLKRHATAANLKECRRRFTSAVKDAAAVIDSESPGQGYGAWINASYDSAIDFGAHPNPRSILPHVEFRDESATQGLVSVAGLLAPGAIELDRAVLACLEFGILLGFLLLHCLDGEPHTRAETELNKLNERKNMLAEQLAQQET